MDETYQKEPSTVAAEAVDGCRVDWTWLRDATIVDATSTLDTLTLRLGNGETLTVRALLWQGKPFLSFDPWRPR